IGNPSLNHRYRKGFYSLFKTLQQNQRSNKVSTWSKNGITEHKGYDKKVLSMYKNVFFEMLERIIQLENEKE
ncbi:hypothetical protein EWI20_15455, partial [Enterococcus faecium]